MPCHSAMLELDDIVTVKPDMTIDAVMKLLDKKKLRSVPVIDDDNILIGMFSTKILLRHLLPVSVTMQDGLQRLGFIKGAAPSIGKRLTKLKREKIEQYVDKEPVVLHTEIPLWEAIRYLTAHGSPLPVIDSRTGKLEGLVSDQSMLELLELPVEELEKLHLN